MHCIRGLIEKFSFRKCAHYERPLELDGVKATFSPGRTLPIADQKCDQLKVAPHWSSLCSHLTAANEICLPMYTYSIHTYVHLYYAHRIITFNFTCILPPGCWLTDPGHHTVLSNINICIYNVHIHVHSKFYQMISFQIYST